MSSSAAHVSRHCPNCGKPQQQQQLSPAQQMGLVPSSVPPKALFQVYVPPDFGKPLALDKKRKAPQKKPASSKTM